MPKPGYVYVATDEDSPGFCKVGQTIDVERRQRTLNGGKMTATIKIAGSVWVDDMDAVEQAFHTILNHRRRKDGGEWFNIDKGDVLPMLECVGKPSERSTPFVTSSVQVVRKRGWWHEDGWQMHCSGNTQAEVAEKFDVSQGAVVSMKKKMRDAGRGNEEENRLRRSVPKQVGNKKKLRSSRTPQSAFSKAIVHVLDELGGRGPAKDVIQLVKRRMQSQLRPGDYARRDNGQIVWVHMVHNARQALKSEGILKSNSPRGWWELA